MERTNLIKGKWLGGLKGYTRIGRLLLKHNWMLCEGLGPYLTTTFPEN